MYNLKESNDIFQDILLPLSIRENERFFYQIIGVPDNKVEYFNKLYLLDQDLRNSNLRCYERYDLCVPQAHTQKAIQDMRDAFKFKDITQKDFVFIKAFDFSGCQSHLDNQKIKQYRKIFTDICNKWYKESKVHKNITFDMIVNFGVKIGGWLNNILSVIDCNPDIIPKVIFYGIEKEHEIYFMELLFNLGFDILYINTQEVSNTKIKDKLDSISKKQKYENVCELPEFPVEEKIVSYETNALKAQNEVNELYYDGQSVLKSWQLQKCSTTNIPLKVTYDELFNLWTVESNMRPSFKVQNNKVYIPNICCKVCGVEDDIKNFCNKIRVLCVENRTKIYEDKSLVPNIDLNFEQSLILQSNLRELLDNDFQLDRKKMKGKPCWHYGYLNPNLQEMLLDHIESILEKGITQNRQKEMIRELSLILNLDKDILNLLQNFDYGFDIPKIILYHSTNMVYSENDGILLSHLNKMGFDIVAITPTRYCDLEDIFSEDILNIFNLGNSAMNLKSPFKKDKQERKSFFERIFD